jgi:hypothetical protein
MTPAPIKLSAEAERHLREVLAATRADQEPAIVWTPEIGVGEPATGEGNRFEGPAIMLGWYRAGQRPRDSFFELCGFSVSILPTTLEHITGKTISREPIPSGLTKGPRHWYALKVG